MENRKEITVGINTKGILVYAEGQSLLHSDKWLVLISRTMDARDCGNLVINRHISHNLSDGRTYFDYGGKDNQWGKSKNYKFYEANDEEKKFIADKLSERGYKFVSVINKLVKKG